jgi:hypothetical protein
MTDRALMIELCKLVFVRSAFEIYRTCVIRIKFVFLDV